MVWIVSLSTAKRKNMSVEEFVEENLKWLMIFKIYQNNLCKKFKIRNVRQCISLQKCVKNYGTILFHIVFLKKLPITTIWHVINMSEEV